LISNWLNSSVITLGPRSSEAVRSSAVELLAESCKGVFTKMQSSEAYSGKRMTTKQTWENLFVE